MKFSRTALILVSLCIMDITFSLNVPRPSTESNLSKRQNTPAPYIHSRGFQETVYRKSRGNAKKASKSAKGVKGQKPARKLPCASFADIPAQPASWHCAGNEKPNVGNLKRPEAADFKVGPVQGVLDQLVEGTHFVSRIGKAYPAEFANGDGPSEIMFPVAGNDLMEFPIHAVGYDDVGMPGAFRVIYKHNRVNNKCEFVGITEHLNPDRRVVKCEASGSHQTPAIGNPVSPKEPGVKGGTGNL